MTGTTSPEGNPKHAMGMRKVPFLSVIPSSALIHEAAAMRYGAYEAPRADGGKGYGPFNWRSDKIALMVYIDAIMRHLLDFVDGQDYAPDSKAHHLAHVRANCGIVLDALENGCLIDNRPKAGKAAELIESMTRKPELAQPERKNET